MSEKVEKDFFNDAYVNNWGFACPRLKKLQNRVVDIVMPGYSIDPTSVPTGGYIENIPGLVWRPDQMVVMWLMDEGWSTYVEVLKWILKIKQTDEEQLPDVVSTASVILRDGHGAGVASLRYDKFFPVGVNSISLSSNSGVPSAVYGVATFGLSDITLDEINGNEFEDLDDLVRP